VHITITSVTNTDSSSIIEYICQYGTGRGAWTIGLPQIGQEYDVELDFDQPLHVGVNIRLADDDAPRICSSEYDITFVARIENIFDEDTASLRLGDSLILVDYEGVFPTIGTWVEVKLPQIELYDTGI
jgi:hypothetical protein